MEKVIQEKQGKLVKKGENIFQKSTIQCSQGHSFDIFENDIILGKWCYFCFDRTETILKNLTIPYSKNTKFYISICNRRR
mgnify:CR=1 FL=1